MKHNYKFIIIILLLMIYDINFSFSFSFYPNNKKIIFTFWEPNDKIPGFLKLCIKTWKKYIPEYEVIILDFKKVRKYLGESLFSEIICQDMSLMVQSDAIRVAILNKYGGIWMDADTIILNDKIIKYFQNFEMAMVWERKLNLHYISFIYATKNSTILNEWQNKIVDNIKQFKKIQQHKENTSSWENSWNYVNSWYYLGNGIIDQIINKFSKKKVFRLDINEANCFPEIYYDQIINNISRTKFFHIDSSKAKVFPEFFYFKNESMHPIQKYLLFYFERNNPQIILNYTKGLIFLHNSWTPLQYKQMSAREFLNQDILLSKLLVQLLK